MKRLLLACLKPLTVLALLASLCCPVSSQAEPRLLVAEQDTGMVRQYSISGADLGVFAAGLSFPSWITADDAGNVYVVEYYGVGLGVGRIDKFSPAGQLLLAITTPFTAAGVRVASDGTIYVVAYGGGPDRGVYRYSAAGTALGLFASLPGLVSGDFIAFDADGNLYAAGRRISPTGADLGSFGTFGDEGITFDSLGIGYVANNQVIRRYSALGMDLGTFASGGLVSPYGLAFDANGNLYVADHPTGTVRKFSPTGADLGIFAAGLVGPRDLVIVDPVTSMPLALERGTVVLDARPNRDRATLEGWFSPPPDGIDPPTDGIAITLNGPAGTMLSLTISGGKGWQTGKGPQWTFRDALAGSAGGSAARESIRIAFDRGKGVFGFWITIDGFDVENAGPGEIVTSLRIGAIEFKGSRDWRLTAKGRSLITP